MNNAVKILRSLNQVHSTRPRMFCMTMADSDKDALTLFIRNLPWTISKTELKLYFSQFGPISDAHVAFNDQTGLSMGYGFVKYTHIHSYVKALQEEHHMLEGHLLDIKQAKFNKK